MAATEEPPKAYTEADSDETTIYDWDIKHSLGEHHKTTTVPTCILGFRWSTSVPMRLLRSCNIARAILMRNVARTRGLL